MDQRQFRNAAGSRSIQSRFPPTLLSALLLTMTASTALEFEEPLMIAHRGASADTPENTVPAIEKAIKQGARVIEFDVRATANGSLVLFHDKDLERLAGRKGTIETLTDAEVAKLDVGAWFADGRFTGERVITLAEAIEICLDGGATPLIEHKTGDAEAYARVVRELEVEEKVIVQSFDWSFLRAFRREIPETTIGALGGKVLTQSKWEELQGMNPDWVVWKYNELTPVDLDLLQAAGFFVALYTVNDPSIVQTWIQRGINGIITDHPGTMLELTTE